MRRGRGGSRYSTPVTTKFCGPSCHSTVVVCPAVGKSAIVCIRRSPRANSPASVVTVTVLWANASPSAHGPHGMDTIAEQVPVEQQAKAIVTVPAAVGRVRPLGAGARLKGQGVVRPARLEHDLDRVGLAPLAAAVRARAFCE